MSTSESQRQNQNPLQLNEMGFYFISPDTLKTFTIEQLKQRRNLLYNTTLSREKEIRDKKVKKIEKSSLIGEILAKRAKEKNISEVYFDRGQYKYHGRLKIFAETLRKNGLKF